MIKGLRAIEIDRSIGRAELGVNYVKSVKSVKTREINGLR
jgi:hypothetical protein